MDGDDRGIGQRLRRVRLARGKSLAVVAGLAGISKQYLSMLETGKRALDSVQLIAALADALEISPTELTRLPVPAPFNGETDSAIESVRLVLITVTLDLPGGQVLPVPALRSRAAALIDSLCRCERERDVGMALPDLIRDLRASTRAGRETPELLRLAVWLHTQATVPWLRLAGAPMDLCLQALAVARTAAAESDDAASLGLVAASSARVMLAGGAFDLAQASVDAVSVPTNTSELMQLAGLLALRRSVIAAADGRLGDVDAPVEYAAELAGQTGESNAFGLGFGPTVVGQFHMEAALEAGDHNHAIHIAERLNPRRYVNESARAAHWVDYGRALSRIRGRHNDAVAAFREGERISPHHVRRNPFVREALGELLVRSRQDAAGRELRGLAHRAGLIAVP